MKKITNKQIEKVLFFLKQHITDCLYMYIDIKKYGIGDNIEVWVNDDDDLKIVIMKYHTSISFITENINPYIDDIISIINNYKILSITSKKSFIDTLSLYLKQYNYSKGWIFKNINYRDCSGVINIELAKVQDIPKIVKLICSDNDIGSYYNEKDLCEQFVERLNEKFGRNYIIREKGKIVAHIATYAEYDNIAIMGGLIVDTNARKDLNKNYGYVIENYMIQQLLSKGYDVYNMVTSQNRYKLMKKTQIEMGSYGKLFISEGNN